MSKLKMYLLSDKGILRNSILITQTCSIYNEVNEIFTGLNFVRRGTRDLMKSPLT